MSKLTIDYVLDLGGSIVNPGTLDAQFLKELRDFIFEYTQKRKRFAIVVGGGFLTRLYQNFLRDNFRVTNEDLDMVGIRPTMLNAELIRVILKENAYPLVLESPHQQLQKPEHFQVFIFSGWKGKTGWSTDHVAVLVAKRCNVKRVLSLTNIKGVYEVAEGVLKRTKIIPRLTWDEYEKMIDTNWIPGMKVPFDPVATREAKTSGMKAVILEGANLENIKRYLEGEEFVGTLIE